MSENDNASTSLGAALGSALAELCQSAGVEVHEDGDLLAELSPFQFEVRAEGKHTVLHLWSEERNLVRRVLRIAGQSDGSLGLEIQKFGRSKPGRLEFVVPERARSDSRLKRERFRARFRQLLAEVFPDDEAESLSSTPDLARSFSGSFTRGLMRRGQRAWAVMGVSGREDATTVDAMLSYALIWLDWQREHARRTAVAGLRLFLPVGSSSVTVHRLQALSGHAPVDIYELDEGAWRTRRVDPKDIGNLATWLTPRREVEQTLHGAREVVERVRALAPEAIDAVVPPGTREVALRFRGLEFARWRHGRLQFGLPDQERRPLDAENWKPLEKLVKGLSAHRSPDAAEMHHPLYRAQAER